MENDIKKFIILKIKEKVKSGDIFKFKYYKINKEYIKNILIFDNNIVF
jgi:hypothetical protein